MFIPLLFYILLLIQNSKAEEKSCSFIFPKRSSECKLSEEDKRSIFNYKQCCFKKDSSSSGISLNHCEAKTEKEYKTMIEKGEKCYNEENPDPKEIYGCESKIPNKASDCVLSNEEKNEGFDYCCYEVYKGEKECNLFTKEEYKLEMELFKIMADEKNDIIKCGNDDDYNDDYDESRFINLTYAFFLILILNL